MSVLTGRAEQAMGLALGQAAFAIQDKPLGWLPGVSNIGDLGRLLEGLPRPLVDFLKVSAITRGAATRLGSSIHDRLRINATYALKVIITSRLHLQKVCHSGSLQPLAQELA